MLDPRPTDCPRSSTRDQTRAVDTVVFDLGGVLLDWDPRHLYRRLFSDADEMERFLSEVCTMDWHAEHDRGRPFAESAAQLASEHPEHSELIWAWGRRSEEMIAGPITGTVEILAELRGHGVRLLALTNMEAETYPLRRDRYEFMRWFEGTLVSSEVGLVKPDPRIFELLLSRYGLDASRTLFVDDAPRNVEAARAVGLRAIRFTAPGDLRAELVRLGLL